MTTLDLRLRPLSTRLIAKYGKAMLLRRKMTGAYNAATGAVTVNDLDYELTGVVTAPSNSMLANGLALGGDRVVQVSAEVLPIEPEPGDQIVMDEAVWQVLSARAIFSGEQVAVYELHTRT